jgi:hypothetical protein
MRSSGSRPKARLRDGRNPLLPFLNVHRIAGEIALMSPKRHAAKAEACSERALAVARAQQAKSWEVRDYIPEEIKRESIAA